MTTYENSGGGTQMMYPVESVETDGLDPDVWNYDANYIAKNGSAPSLDDICIDDGAQGLSDASHFLGLSASSSYDANATDFYHISTDSKAMPPHIQSTMECPKTVTPAELYKSATSSGNSPYHSATTTEDLPALSLAGPGFTDAEPMQPQAETPVILANPQYTEADHSNIQAFPTTRIYQQMPANTSQPAAVDYMPNMPGFDRPSSAPPIGPNEHMGYERNDLEYPDPRAVSGGRIGAWLEHVSPPYYNAVPLSAPTSASYYHHSISYPGSPTQPMNPGYRIFGQPGLPLAVPRQTYVYSRQPNYTSHPQPNVIRNISPPAPRRYRCPSDDFTPTKYIQIGPNSSSEHQSERYRKRQLHNKRRAAYHHASDDSGTDYTQAVKLPTRRTKNPGRKSKIPQTEEVLNRNRVRRERYRAGLDHAARAKYDRDSALAKGLLD